MRFDSSFPEVPNVLLPFFRPCILIFDSLATGSRARVAATLRDYLQCEYDAKVKGDRRFDKDSVKGCCPRVPQQPNFSDCGIFVLQYCESFFEVSYDAIRGTQIGIPLEALGGSLPVGWA